MIRIDPNRILSRFTAPHIQIASHLIQSHPPSSSHVASLHISLGEMARHLAQQPIHKWAGEDCTLQVRHHFYRCLLECRCHIRRCRPCCMPPAMPHAALATCRPPCCMPSIADMVRLIGAPFFLMRHLAPTSGAQIRHLAPTSGTQIRHLAPTSGTQIRHLAPKSGI